MQKVLMPIKVRRSDGSVDTEQDYFYLASDVDDRIAELEKALREITALDYANAATNGAAYCAVQIARAALRL